MRFLKLWGVFIFALTLSCSSQSKATSLVTLTLDERARQALDAEDYALAVELYNEELSQAPDHYEIYPYLGAAYAGLAGFDIVAAALSNIEASASTSLIDRLGTFLPANPNDEQLDAMRLAKETISSLPADHRDRSNATVAYASGAALQLELYQSAYAIMYLNQFTSPTVDGQLDPARLETMTDADVDIILNNLSDIADQAGSGVGTGAAQVISQIDAQPGETRRDKLLKYINPSRS